MRLASIELEWFRGAAETITLPVKGKSVVVYGPNGAGKSSFVDAIEYLLSNGKIGHLSHEYSGKKQEKGVINTHKPTLSPTRIALTFVNGDRVDANVQVNGTFSLTGVGELHIAGLDYRRVVLRQDEVAAFISSAKGAKYSALLPLLGLEERELAAENVRQLAKRVAKAVGFDAKSNALATKTAEARSAFSSLADVETKIAQLHARYRQAVPREPHLADDCRVLQGILTTRLKELGTDVQRHAALRNLASTDIEKSLTNVDGLGKDIAALSVTMLEERVALLDNATEVFASNTAETVTCPACGSSVTRVALTAHLESERRRFAADKLLLDKYRTAVAELENRIATTQAACRNPLVSTWWSEKGASNDIAWLAKVVPHSLQGQTGAAVREGVRSRLLPMIRAAESATLHPPPGTVDLLADSETLRAADALLATAVLGDQVSRLQAILNHLKAVESSIRKSIREHSDIIISSISTDIQRMWGILHPGYEIEDVRLSHPDEADKAIDIELKFFGVDLKSPRLTLSEGNRNSLGLCVFLSMAKRADVEVPVVLDDVVVSLDRDHRGMVVELLMQEFGERQILLFTHDRDWFAELRYMLDSGAWDFYSLLPYTGPTVGISWSSRISTFGDARAQLSSAPDASANIARKIMDTELAFLADKLKLRLEYRQGLRNDHRMAHEFLVDLLVAAKKAFQRKDATGKHIPDGDVLTLLSAADKAILAWGNKGSHTFDVAKVEATQLIESCERVLGAFQCTGCDKAIYKLDDGSGVKQCSCGSIRWRYDKL